jgi:putative endopeptidase
LTIASVGQGGLGLPERDYYFRDDDKSKQLREQYVAHVAKMLELSGETPAAAQTAATAVMRIETALAKGSKPVAELRDPVANYHKLPLAEVKKLAPDFDWPGYFKGIGLADAGDIDVGQPEFLQAFNALLGGEPVASWQAYLRWHLVHGAAAYLSTPYIEENFAFYGKILTGRKTLRDRWKRVLDMTDGAVGEALGQLYVADNFPAASKARVLQLVANLRAVLRERLQTLDWMDEPTRAAALKKIDAFGVKIGYPDKWIDYSSLTLNRGPFVLNALRADEFNVRRDLAKIGKPFDRTEWLMAPQEINAYYNPTMNEIVFPAGILQPPFFDATADDAVNYGAIGMVIGHEMTHGFDDQGRQFGADGTLKDWWTEESAKRFAERSKAIVAQYSAYTVVDDLKLNGELSQGENIADLGGLKIAFTALQRTFGGRPQPKIGGFTPEQRFFLSYANAWRSSWRPEMIRLVANSDPHPPPRIRVNGPLSNLPEFAEAFAIPEGSPLRRPAAERVVIW